MEGFWNLQFKRANHIKCPKCGATGRMSLSPQRDSGWCEACYERSELAAPPTRWSRRGFFEAISVTSGLITIGELLSKFIPKRHVVNIAATVSGRARVDIAVLKPAPATLVMKGGVSEVSAHDNIKVDEHVFIAVEPIQG
jgi:hypothetical protein